jgi:hypothetical protein
MNLLLSSVLALYDDILTCLFSQMFLFLSVIVQLRATDVGMFCYVRKVMGLKSNETTTARLPIKAKPGKPGGAKPGRLTSTQADDQDRPAVRKAKPGIPGDAKSCI